MIEEWRPIVGYEGSYEVSNLGRVKSLSRRDSMNRLRPERILRLAAVDTGYLHVGLFKNGVGKLCLVHRLVGRAFIPNPLNKPCINHINCVRSDNRRENLEWFSTSENNKYAYTHGHQTTRSGESHPLRKLTQGMADEIRKKYKRHFYTMPMLAAEYNVATTTIQAVLDNRTWLNDFAKKNQPKLITV